MTNNYITVTAGCRICGAVIELQVNEAGLRAWQEGRLIQNALPELGRAERELLISGICGTCFDRMFRPKKVKRAPLEIALLEEINEP